MNKMSKVLEGAKRFLAVALTAAKLMAEIVTLIHKLSS